MFGEPIPTALMRFALLETLSSLQQKIFFGKHIFLNNQSPKSNRQINSNAQSSITKLAFPLVI
jgi:hypothetical protein